MPGRRNGGGMVDHSQKWGDPLAADGLAILHTPPLSVFLAPSLKTHMMTKHYHSFCSKCDKFISLEEDVLHTSCSKLSQNMEPIFQCDLCEKIFKGRRGLKNHIMHIQDKNSSKEWGTLKVKKLFVNSSCLGVFSEKYPHPMKKDKPLMHLHSKLCWLDSNNSSHCKDRPKIIPNQDAVLSEETFLPEVHVFYQTVSVPYNKEKIWWYKLKQILEERVPFSDLKF